MSKIKSSYLLSLLISINCSAVFAQETDDIKPERIEPEDVMTITAAQQTRQAPGVSVITSQDIQKTPVKNDIAEIVKTMPGVSLAGNSNSGQRGNNRQIDIRGMGPENTLILIDGKPVKSRMSVRYAWGGERDTRGDTNWIPADLVERIDVIRGPAAARYGDGAAGGVINIITKQASGEFHGSINSYINLPTSSKEGATKRTNFMLSNGLTDTLTFRLYGNLNKTDADAWDINKEHRIDPNALTAGKEGVRNKDINGLLRWDITEQQSLDFEAGLSRQGNIYAGDTQNNNPTPIISTLYNDETNRIYRQNYAITHHAHWAGDIYSLSYIQYEKTNNSRLPEGLAGGTEGRINSKEFRTTTYDSLTLHSETNIPLDISLLKRLIPQMLTIGVEYNYQKMDDPASNTQSTTEAGSVPWIKDTDRDTKSSAGAYALFLEDNIELTSSTMLTPALRFDHHSKSGSNWSPALNLSQELGDYFTLKLGIARAYKSPNLYQTNPNYLLYSRGNGCKPGNGGSGGRCYLIGTENLKPETSINKEIGLEFHNRDNLVAGVTYFRNDYHNKIQGGNTLIATTKGTDKVQTDIFPWENLPSAVVEGLEGSFSTPIMDKIVWRNNLTWMLTSENKQTGDYLSIIPRYTLNSSISWQTTDKLSLLTSLTWYGKQKPKKYDLKGKPAEGSSLKQLSPYSIANFSGQYQFNKKIAVTAGVNNIFNKRLYREGNSTGSKGAGAATYNEPSRTFYLSSNISF